MNHNELPIPYRYAILVLPLDTRLVFIVKDFGKALLKTKSSPSFFSYKLSERKTVIWNCPLLILFGMENVNVLGTKS